MTYQRKTTTDVSPHILGRMVIVIYGNKWTEHQVDSWASPGWEEEPLSTKVASIKGRSTISGSFSVQVRLQSVPWRAETFVNFFTRMWNKLLIKFAIFVICWWGHFFLNEFDFLHLFILGAIGVCAMMTELLINGGRKKWKFWTKSLDRIFTILAYDQLRLIKQV